MAKDRLIVGLSGASGVILGIRFLEVLSTYENIETHLVVSDAGKRTIELETDWKIKDVEAFAGQVHDFTNIGSSIASGSFRTKGRVIVPCSIKTHLSHRLFLQHQPAHPGRRRRDQGTEKTDSGPKGNALAQGAFGCHGQGL